MNALTRINANTKVKYDVMNNLEAEIEARDKILDDKINVLKTKTEIDIPYNSGFSTYGDSKIIINGLKEGKLICAVQKTDGTNFVIGTHTIATLPIGFKSKYNMSMNITTELPAYGSGYGHIYQNNIIIDLNTSCKAIKFVIDYEGE